MLTTAAPSRRMARSAKSQLSMFDNELKVGTSGVHLGLYRVPDRQRTREEGTVTVDLLTSLA